MTPSENQLLKRALKGRYAVPAFNYSDIWELLAIVEVAKEEHAPVYLCSNMRVATALGVEYCGALGREAYRLSKNTVLHHLDHATDPNLCQRAVDCGYQSVMIDSSAYSLEENIAQGKAVAEYAHAKGVLVEAEIGRIMGKGMEGNFSGGDYLADTVEAIQLATETGVDSLAVGIGNAHGFYAAPPHLNIERLKEIHHSLLGIPLVLHGGTGIPEEQIRDCITNGIAKINVGTLLHSTYLNQLRIELSGPRSGYSLPDYFEPVRDAVKEKARSWIHICRADGRV